MYVGAVKVKNFPFLNEKVPMCNELITSEQIMSAPVLSMRYKMTVQSIFNALTKYQFDGFPIINSQSQCIGLVNRHSLMVILANVDRMTEIDQKGGKATAAKGYGQLDSTERSDEDETGERRHSSEGLRNRKVQATDDSKDDLEEEQFEEVSHGILDSNGQGLDWDDFNVDFHSSVPDIKEKRFIQAAQQHGQKLIDLRPFMVPRPFTVFENDNLQKGLDLFRLMNLRHLPVLSEENGKMVGMITRQDIFAFI